MGYVVGVDGGGTKTTAAVVRDDGVALGTDRAGPANSRSVGTESAGRNIAVAIAAALASAHIALKDVDCIVMCCAGFDTDLDLEVPRTAMQSLGYKGPVIAENDVVGAWAGATGGEPGVVMISGTGATGMGMNEKREFWRTDGWDTLLGDDGSGYNIGHLAIRAAMRALDGRGPRTALVTAMEKAFGAKTAQDMRRMWDSGHAGKFEIADFAIAVEEVAKQGDAIATEILSNAGQALLNSAAAIVRELDLAHVAFPLCTVGSTINRNEPVRSIFLGGIHTIAPGALIRDMLHSPEMGAALLGFQRLKEDDLGSWTLGTGKRVIRRSHTAEEVAG
ncbi:MAG TPA: BadF/BadG/BcrA/BcrD ATPase family protein [Ktedonobacterales bacterium]